MEGELKRTLDKNKISVGKAKKHTSANLST